MMDAKGKGPLIFFDFVNHYGGSNQSTVILIEELRKQTNVAAVDVYGSCSDYINALRTKGIDFTILLSPKHGRTYIGGVGRLQRMFQMILFLPDMLRILWKLREYVSNIHPRAVWVNSEKALFTCWLALPGHTPLAVYVRGEMKAIRWYCLFAWRRANLVIGISKKSLQHLISANLVNRNLYTIYNGIDVKNAIRASEKEINRNVVEKDGLRILLPASIGSPLKGHKIAIHAFARFLEQGGEGHLFICGDVPPGAPKNYYERIQNLVTELGLSENVHFLGWQNDILAVMRRCDLVLLPSFSEGLPRSLLQAMALGKPVIATRVGGIPELVRDKIDGLLIRPGDVNALMNALFELVDPNKRELMGNAAQKRVKENFSLTTQASEFLNKINGISESKCRKLH